MGIVVYEGPSEITGKPIVGILTGENGSDKSKNAKTGDMVQLWILDGDVSPTDAIKTGADESVCGSCPLRGLANGTRAVGRSCYVNVGQAPLQIWRTYKSGTYPKATSLDIKRALAGRKVRLGAYGDPAALPIAIIRKLVKHSDGHTGYTHEWRRPSAKPYARYLMASVESPEGASLAQGMGWRTFRVRNASDAVLGGEIRCPASDEMGHKRTCEQCLACDGRTRAGQVSVVIVVHGGMSEQRGLRV